MGLALLGKTLLHSKLAQFVTKLVERMINKAVVGSGCRGGCGIGWDTQCSGCAIAAVLLSVYSHFRQFCGRCTLDVARPKHIILYADITSLKGAVTSYMTSQHCTCIGHVTFYYKRSANTLVGGACLLFICSSGLTLSPETCGWLVPNACRLRCI